jgi:exoribonuclease R
LLNSRLVVRIDDWDRTSNYPEGHYLYQLGEIGNIEAETRALLVEHEIAIASFSDNAMSSLPLSATAWKVSNDEVYNKQPTDTL